MPITDWDSAVDKSRPNSFFGTLQGSWKVIPTNIFMLFLDIIQVTCEILKAISYLQHWRLLEHMAIFEGMKLDLSPALVTRF